MIKRMVSTVAMLSTLMLILAAAGYREMPASMPPEQAVQHSGEAVLIVIGLSLVGCVVLWLALRVMGFKVSL